MDLKCRMMPPLVGSSHLCDIRVHSGRIFNHFDSRKNFKSSIQSFQRLYLLGFGSRLAQKKKNKRVPAWFIVSRNGFKRNLWTWSSEKSLARFFLWWLQRNFPEIHCLCDFIPIRTQAACGSLRTVRPHQYAPPQEPHLFEEEGTNLSSDLFAAANSLLCLRTFHSQSSPLKWKSRLLAWKKPTVTSRAEEVKVTCQKEENTRQWWGVTAQTWQPNSLQAWRWTKM